MNKASATLNWFNLVTTSKNRIILIYLVAQVSVCPSIPSYFLVLMF